ncbi:protein SHQ1 homolog [Montipora foliosa]|uniref:protein SHQ1 homolog n=1 Tax=Montipora foliosa TaxID=591990 RepID=UPI0035F216EE
MIPPVFDLSQDDDFVLVIIRTPYVKISDVEFYIDGTEFKFYVKPYFLRLNLPGELVEDGRESATYDLDKGTFSVKLPKLHPGEFFEDLDLLTTLLAPRRQAKSTTKALIEETGKGESINEVRQENGSKSEDEDFDWDIEQQLPPASQENIAIALGDAKYGFANQKSGIFKGREAELHEIAEIHDPESMTLAERRKFRKEAEDVKFDEEYYLADFFNEEQIQPLLNYKPPWSEIVLQEGKSVSIKKKDDSSRPNESKVHFTDAEKDQLRRLPNRDYLLDKEEELSLYLGLVDIIYAYAYNHRTTEGENTVESSWTIARISSTFSWFESFTTLSDVLISSAHRSLAYPLYRHWSLVDAVIKDTKKIFALGRRQILKCLLEIHALCREEDPWYLLNDLYVTDYCIWIQKASRNKLASLAHSLEQIEIRKSELSWQLEELELAATLVQKEEQGDAGDQEASEQQKENEDVTNSDNEEDRDKDDVDDDDVDDDDDEDNDDDDDDDDDNDDDVEDDIVDNDYDDDYGDEDDDDEDTDDDHSTRHKTEANVKTVNADSNGDICWTLHSVESRESTTTEFVEDQVKL